MNGTHSAMKLNYNTSCLCLEKIYPSWSGMRFYHFNALLVQKIINPLFFKIYFSIRNKRVAERSPEFFHQCLHKELETSDGEATPHIYTVKGALEWERRVCEETDTLDLRVKELLKALPCPQHKVCQILSPEDLQELAKPPKQCRQKAQDLWKNLFHKLYLIIRDFSDVFQQKFDIGNYSAMHENQRCKVRKNKFFGVKKLFQ